MFGLGTAPGRAGLDAPVTTLRDARSEADEAVGRLHLRGDDAGRAMRSHPLDLDVLQRCLDRLAEPLADPLRVAGDLQARQRVRWVGAVARVEVLGAVPLD